MCITALVSSLPGEVAGDDLAVYFEAVTGSDIDHCEMLGGGKARVKLQGVTPGSKYETKFSQLCYMIVYYHSA